MREQRPSTPHVARDFALLVAPLKATVGTMNYEVPDDIDVSKYQSM